MSPPAPVRAHLVHPDRQRILHAVFSSRIAGSERYCIDLANRQSAMGHEVHVVGSPTSPLRHALAPGVQFRGLGRLFRGWQLRRLIARLRPDVCHGHLSAACKALGRSTGNHRTVATLHVGYKPHQHARLDGLICVNRAQAASITNYAGTVRTIGNWQPTAPATLPGGIRAELGLDPRTFLVGAVGRLHSSKGNDVLIEAFRAVAPDDAALVILGDGPQRKSLEKLRAGDARIHFVGHRPVVQGCLRDLDLFVSPSREESFGLAIVEAMEVGVPIIATAAEGPVEFLRHQPAVLVPTGSVGALAAALEQAHAQFCAGRLGRVNYDLSLFDPDARVANIMDFYGQLAQPSYRHAAAPTVPAVAVAT